MMGQLWWAMWLGCRPTNTDSASVASPPERAAEMVLGSACGPLDEPSDARALVFEGAPPKNLIIISIDTLRRDRVGRYSGESNTPFLDEHLASAVALDNLLACANWTLPGVFCAVSGRSMLESGLEPIDSSRIEDPTYLSPELPTMAGHLQTAGWHTALVTTSKLFSDKLPTGNGFDTVVFNSDMNAGAMVTAAEQALSDLQAAANDDPWYLQLHFRDPHGPYNPPGAYQGDLAGTTLTYDPRTSEGISEIYGALDSLSEEEITDLQAVLEALYAGELRYLDDELKALWQSWESSGVLADTMVVMWSDHGEQFLEHAGFQHGASLHQEEAWALGSFWAENLEPAAISAPTLHTDIPATILDVYGISADMSGMPIGAVGNARARVSVARNKDFLPLFSVDREGHRMLYGWDGTRAYYQTPNDPEEQQDRYDPTDPNVICLWEYLQPALDAVDDSNLGPPVQAEP